MSVFEGPQSLDLQGFVVALIEFEKQIKPSLPGKQHAFPPLLNLLQDFTIAAVCPAIHLYVLRTYIVSVLSFGSLPLSNFVRLLTGCINWMFFCV